MVRSSALTLGFLLSLPVSTAVAQAVLDPTTPIGIEAGRFTLFPAIETELRSSVGPATAPGVSVTVSPELLIRSNWARHAGELLFDIDLDVTGALTAAVVELGLAFDIGNVWALELGAAHALDSDDRLDPALPAGVDSTPDIRTSEADIAIAGPVGDFAFELRANVERTVHDNALMGGIPVDQSERDSTVVTAGLRLERSVGALIAPFAEVSGGRRLYDVAVGSDGFLQAGNFADLRAGIAYDSAPVLTAEVAVGAHLEMPDDPALSNATAFTIDINAVWSPREVMVVTLTSETGFHPNAGAAMGSSVNRGLGADIRVAVRETLTLTGEAAWGREAFADGTIETATALGAGVVWSPTPRTEFSLSYQHSWLASPDPDRAGSNGTITLRTRITP